MRHSMNAQEVHVSISQVKKGKPGELLKTTLGSCVGIAMFNVEDGLFALAHCLLPESYDSPSTLGAKFVDQAIESLMAILDVKSSMIPRMKVYIAGGANMMPSIAKIGQPHIGALNLEAARKHLQLKGFKFTELDVAGTCARQMFLNCEVGEASVKRIQEIKEKSYE